MLTKKVKEVLLELQKNGLLDQLILIGSWCGIFYIQYFGDKNYSPSIQTLDVDFLIPKPYQLKGHVGNVPEILKAMDFDTEFSGSGWIRFVHPEIRVEFLVPRLGPQSDNPKKIPALKINAMPLRHTHILTNHTLVIEQENIKVKVPHPVAFALHKLMVSNRRKDRGKSIRDQEMALRILDAQEGCGKPKEILRIWESFTKKEKKEILSVLDRLKIISLSNLLK